jgi:short-subunit dehydrogenase
MTGWSEVLASDLLETGVKVHLIVPGAIDTEIWQKVQEPAAYNGKFIPPQKIADAVRECLEKGTFERWVPRRLQPASIFRSIAPGAYIRGIHRFDKRADRNR